MQLETSSIAIERYDPFFTSPERVALTGFLAGYSGLTREAYALDLRQFATWCTERHLALFCARRADIESFGRDLETKGRARATIARRLGTVTGFYRYAVEEGLIEHSPAVHVRKPRLDYESHAVGLDRNEVGALLVARAWLAPATTRWSRCCASTACGCPKPSAPTSNAWRSSAAIARSPSCAREPRW
jgi:integrase/recombinase XerD